MRKIAIIIFVILGIGFLASYQKKSNYKEGLNIPTKAREALKKPTSFSIVLNEQGGSGQSGLATFEVKNDVIAVRIRLVGFVPDVTQPAHIHKGTCEEVGEDIFYITPVVNGQTDTNIISDWDELAASFPLVLNVHKSEAEKDIYTSCGQVSP